MSVPGADVASEKPDAKYQETIRELVDALELCLECDGLTWEAEREAEILVTRYKTRVDMITKKQ
jgi:hypothetical protein